MKQLLTNLKAWYRRRFRGYVAAPVGVGGRGTAWQQHRPTEVGFTCSGIIPGGRYGHGTVCRAALAFTAADYVIRARDHHPDCRQMSPAEPTSFFAGTQVERTRYGMFTGCGCPFTDARYVKICPGCGLGHWKQAL